MGTGAASGAVAGAALGAGAASVAGAEAVAAIVLNARLFVCKSVNIFNALSSLLCLQFVSKCNFTYFKIRRGNAKSTNTLI